MHALHECPVSAPFQGVQPGVKLLLHPFNRGAMRYNREESNKAMEAPLLQLNRPACPV